MKMRTLGIVGWLLFVLVCLAPETARAVACGTGAGTCFALTGNTNVGTSWSDTDGGANCNATCPTGPAAGDACILTSVSGALTINAALSCSSFNACAITGTAAYASTLTHNAAVTLTISGNDAGAPAGGITFCLSSGMTYTRNNTTTSALAFTATSGTSTITANSSGASRNTSNISINGSGGTFELGSALTVNAAATFTHTVGTFTTNNNAFSMGLWDESGTTARVFNAGSSAITVTATTGSVINFTTSANLTFNAGTSTVDVAATATGSRTLAPGGKTFNVFNVTNPTTNSQVVLFATGGGGGATATNITFTNTRYISLNGGTTLTVSGTLAFSGGTVAAPLLFISNGNGAGSLVLSNNTVATNLVIQNITRSGAGSFTANDSYDGGNNTSITINPPASGGRIIGG